MRITPAGNVGIGTTNPQYALDVVGAIHASTGFNTGVKGSILGTSAGSSSAPAASDANILLYYGGSTNWAGIGADVNGSMWFRTGTSGTPDPRMVIGNAGNVGIGVLSPNYYIHLGADSAAKPGTNTWTVASDARLKRDIRPFVEGLETLLKLRPTSFVYNGEADQPDGLEGVGLIAQEAAPIIPSCVRRTPGVIDGEETEILALNTSDLQWMVINALRQNDERLRKANL
jgi:hypothetical protein